MSWLLRLVAKAGLIVSPETKAYMRKVKAECRECRHADPGHFGWCASAT